MKSIGNRVSAAFLAAIISCGFVVSQDQIILEASNVVYAADAYSLSAPSRPEEKYVSLHCGGNHMLHAAHKICFCII